MIDNLSTKHFGAQLERYSIKSCLEDNKTVSLKKHEQSHGEQ